MVIVAGRLLWLDSCHFLPIVTSFFVEERERDSQVQSKAKAPKAVLGVVAGSLYLLYLPRCRTLQRYVKVVTATSIVDLTYTTHHHPPSNPLPHPSFLSPIPANRSLPSQGQCFSFIHAEHSIFTSLFSATVADMYRRNSSHKGWQSNAGQQKYNGSPAPTASSSPTPGQAMKSRTASSSAHGESDTHDKHMHDRTLFLLTRLLVSFLPPPTRRLLNLLLQSGSMDRLQA